MKTALVILAAGIGPRYGGGIMQLEPVGPMGEIIMDYSIHDAIAAGFDKIVFIIRRDIEADFRQVIGDRIEAICRRLGVEVAYAFQELEHVPKGAKVPTGRKKPWGTGQALLACREVLHEPFAVINADDYYGKEAFGRLYAFLQHYDPRKPGAFCMAGFILRNTLSEHGGVTRGICHVGQDGYLQRVIETRNVVKQPHGAAVQEPDGSLRPLDPDCFVSMNMWGMTPEFLQELDRGFRDFFRRGEEELDKTEFLIPIFVDQLLQEGKISVRVLPTADRWFGVTYREDKPQVAEAFRALIAAGEYGADLFAGLRPV